MENHRDVLRPVVFGETLYDIFLDGSKVLGGAPFNVAWHLQGFGAFPELVTAIGSDTDGDEVVEAMEKWGMSTKRVSTLEGETTGNVQVTLTNRSPSFMIELEQAFDFIPPCDTCKVECLYFGTLALRSEVSRNSLLHLRDRASKVFVDVNIRYPWFNAAYLPSTIKGADWLKASTYELKELTELPTASTDEIFLATAKLKDRYGIQNFIITAGGKGAWLINDKGVLFQKAYETKNFVDSVGAGDAFSAVSLYGVLSGWSDGDILDRSLLFASKICEVRGAITHDQEFYTKSTALW